MRTSSKSTAELETRVRALEATAALQNEEHERAPAKLREQVGSAPSSRSTRVAVDAEAASFKQRTGALHDEMARKGDEYERKLRALQDEMNGVTLRVALRSHLAPTLLPPWSHLLRNNTLARGHRRDEGHKKEHDKAREQVCAELRAGTSTR